MPASALMNVMDQAARKAARGLARDFGEVENLLGEHVPARARKPDLFSIDDLDESLAAHLHDVARVKPAIGEF